MQDAANSGAAASGAEAQEQPAAAGAAPETAAWDPMRFLPSTLVEMDDGNGAEADSGPLMPLDRKVSCSADFPIHGKAVSLEGDLRTPGHTLSACRLCRFRSFQPIPCKGCVHVFNGSALLVFAIHLAWGS